MKKLPFPETRWSLVLRLRAPSAEERHAALNHLCKAYWQPLYAFACSQGHNHHDAEDLTQGFITQLLERNRSFGEISPERGRFRTFLKTAFTNFLIDHARRLQTRKRGGKVERISLDAAMLADGPAAERTQLDVLDREWARTLVRRSLERLREKFARKGKARLVEKLEPFLLTSSPPAYRDVAKELGASEVAIRSSVSRLRAEFHELLRAEVADTVSNRDEVDAELRHLLRLTE